MKTTSSIGRTFRRISHPTVLLLTALPLMLVAVLATSHGVAEEPATGHAEVDDDDQVERGRYLVGIMGCDDCHTPFVMGEQGPEPDVSRRLSGHPAALELPPPPEPDGPWVWMGAATNTAFAGPWGISYAINLTPHATGMAGWTEEMFVKSMKTGWHRGVEDSRRIMPPMPWPAYSHATEEDLRAIYAFVQSIEPIDNTVPAYQPPAEAAPEE